RGLDRVFSGWINNITGATPATAAYTGGHAGQWLFASNRPRNPRFEPGGAAPAPVAPHIPDTGRIGPAAGALSATLTSSDIRARGANPDGPGVRLGVHAVDSPQLFFARRQPGFAGSVITRVNWNLEFRAYLGLWTNARGLQANNAAAASQL